MREEGEGEEEMDIRELRRLIEKLESLIMELEIKIWKLYRKWWEQKLKGLMMEKSKEYFEELHRLEGILHQLEAIHQFIKIHMEGEEFTTGEELRPLMEKLERGEVLNADEVASLMRIEEFARSEGRGELLREVERAFTKLGELTKNIAVEPEKMELKKGEIKEIDENTLIRRRKDGKLELILL